MMMKKLALLRKSVFENTLKLAVIGALAFLILAGTASATTRTCNSCASCTANISASSAGDTVLLTSNFTSDVVFDVCIGFSGNGGNITFDCQGYWIVDGGMTLLGIYSPKDNTIIKNCNVRDFQTIGQPIVVSGNNISVDNIYTADNGASGSGIFIGGSTNSTFNNIRSTNNNIGIDLGSGNLVSGNNITNSRFWGNTYGIEIGYATDNNNLFYNNLLNNTVNYHNSTAITGTNYWNTTMKAGTNIIGGGAIGGNYWAYPNGTGYSQTCTNANNDSFCDTPYDLGGGNIDYLPLTLNQPPKNYTCNSCASCTANISASSAGDTVLLTTNITSPDTSPCISFDKTGITFDCKGHWIVDDSGTSLFGIDLEGSINSNTTVKNCNVRNFYMVGYGIVIDNSNNIKFDNIYIAQESNYGITVTSSNSIFNNIRATNNGVGIVFGDTSSNNIISNSTIWNNNIGIQLEGLNSNNLFYNNLLNNTINFDNNTATGTNYWNTTKTNGTNIVGRSQIGGNYWAYPNGTGYSQTCTNANNDSFCDNPYTIASADYLPLTLNQPSASSLNITFVSPTPDNGTTINSTSFTANVSSNGTVSSCTLTLDGTNYSMAIASGNLSASKANSGLSQGIHRYNATCDGFMTETRALSVDSVAPIITITSPANTSYNTISIVLQVSASETVNVWWYKLNGGTNTTFIPNTTIITIQGSNNIIIYANDTVGNTGSAIASFFIDSIPPTITIYSPQSMTYNTATVSLQVSSGTESVNTWWYSLNGGVNITFVPNITVSAIEGINTISVYGNDSSGNIASSAMTFTVSTPEGQYNRSLTRYFLLLIPLLAAVIIIVLMLKRIEERTITFEMMIEMGVTVIVLMALVVVLSMII